MQHTPVLLQESVEALALTPGLRVIDATGGSGGHSLLLAERVGAAGQLLVIDQDPEALPRIAERLHTFPQAQICLGNFRSIELIAVKEGFVPVAGVLFDLGVSSEQIEQSGRGFSFLREEPLLMTLGSGPYAFTAETIVNEWEEEVIADIIFGYGEETAARRIAKAIVDARRKAPFKNSRELAETVSAAHPRRGGRIHPATKTFQALRIAVNDELGALREGLSGAFHILQKGGRLSVISFHALEARIIKEFFKQKEVEGSGRRIHKHAIRPTREEVLANPRSRSASLYTLQKLS